MRISDWSSDVCSSDLLLYSIEGPLRHARPVEQQRRKMSQIEDIEVEMYRKMRDSLGLDPVEDRPAAVSKDGWRDMLDAQFLQDQVFIRVPYLHVGDHHTPGVQLAGHFCRESLVDPAKQQGKNMGMGVRKLGSDNHVGLGTDTENAQLINI